MKKNKPQNHSAASPQGGAAAHSDIVLPIVPRQVSRKAGAKAAAQTSEPSKEPASQQECQLVGISCTSLMGFILLSSGNIVNLSNVLYVGKFDKHYPKSSPEIYCLMTQDGFVIGITEEEYKDIVIGLQKTAQTRYT